MVDQEYDGRTTAQLFVTREEGLLREIHQAGLAYKSKFCVLRENGAA